MVHKRAGHPWLKPTPGYVLDSRALTLNQLRLCMHQGACSECDPPASRSRLDEEPLTALPAGGQWNEHTQGNDAKMIWLVIMWGGRRLRYAFVESCGIHAPLSVHHRDGLRMPTALELPPPPVAVRRYHVPEPFWLPLSCRISLRLFNCRLRPSNHSLDHLLRVNSGMCAFFLHVLHFSLLSHSELVDRTTGNLVSNFVSQL
ncbi:hypothetical protein C8R44DRAFT_855273, partial [Mycena epipterygia]